MTTADKEFQSSKNIEEFLSNNAIITTENIYRNYKLPRSKKGAGMGKKIKSSFFTLKLATDWKAGGTAKKVYELTRAPEVSFLPSIRQEGFKAYWLAYEPNQTYRNILGNDDTKYMFTANMSGCTFAYGSQTDSGHILVGHSNAMTVGTETYDAAMQANKTEEEADRDASIAQATAQLDNIRAKFAKKEGSVTSVLHPMIYGAESYNDTNIPNDPLAQYGAFVVGVKADNKWAFYCQRRVVLRKQVIVHDAVKI